MRYNPNIDLSALRQEAEQALAKIREALGRLPANEGLADSDALLASLQAYQYELEQQNTGLHETQFAMNKVGIGIEWIDPETGRFTFVNDHAARVLGYLPEEMLELSISDIDPIVAADPHRQVRIEQIRREKHASFETIHRAKDGREFPVEIVLYYREATASQPERFISFVSDITARKAAEAELSLHAAIVNSSEDAIIGKTLDGRVTTWNKGAEEIFGYSAKEMIGQPLTRLFPPGLETEESFILEQVQRKEELRHFETTRICKDGSLIQVSVAISPILNEHGQVIGASKIARNITREKALEEGNAQLLQALNESSNFVGIANLDGATRYVNTGGLRMLGLSPQTDFSGRSIRDFHPAWSADKIIEEALPVAMAHRRWQGELGIYDASGTEIPVAATIFPLTNPAGEITALATIQTDLREFKAREIAREEERRRLEDIVAGTQAGTWEWNLENGELTINSRSFEMLGYYPKSLAPQPQEKWQRLIHPEDLDLIHAWVDRQCAASPEYLDLELRERHKAGHWAWILTRGRVTRWSPEGKPLAMSGIHLDITDRKQAEALVVQSERFLRDVTDALPGMVGYWDSELRNRFANKAYLEWFGKTPQEMNGMRIQDFFGPSLFALNEPYLRRALAGVRQRFQRTLTKTDGSQRHTWAEYIPFENEGRIDGFIALVLDVTELHQARLVAESANLAKSRFLSTMSHEIRTPLNGVLGMAQMLLEKDIDDSQRMHYAKTILDSGRDLLGMLNNILDISKIEAGRFSLECAPFQPLQLVEEVAALFQATARQKQLAVDWSWSGNPEARYLGDAPRLRQMLANLLSNALKFTDSGSIAISVSPVASEGRLTQLEFSVADNGIGIAAEAVSHLFDPFSQADNSITRRYGGTGLGLSIVRSLAKLMQGTVGVESTPGQGSRFWFTVQVETPADASLPGNRPALPHPAQPEAMPAGRPQFSGKVLVVEDNPTNRSILLAFLQILGLKTAFAENGRCGVKAVQEDRAIDLVLMDLHMPELDGYDATSEIRAWEGALGRPRLPIIAVTADAFSDDRMRCLTLGMDAYLAKPVELDTLANELARFLPHTWPAPQSAVTPKKIPVDRHLLRQRLKELKALLGLRKVGAAMAFKNLQSVIAGTDIADDFSAMAHHIDDFRFAAALQDIERMTKKHRWMLDEQ